MESAAFSTPAAGWSSDITHTGSLSIDIDRLDDVICVDGAGFWTPTQVDKHFERLAAVVAARRRASGEIRILVDLRGAAAQSPETAARITVATDAIYGPTDRVAVVLRSSLAKLQMRRVIQRLRHEMFISPEAALTWLRAYLIAA